MIRPVLLLSTLLSSLAWSAAATAAVPGTPVAPDPGSPEARRAVSDFLIHLLEAPVETRGEEPFPEHLKPCRARFHKLADTGFRGKSVVATLPDPVESPFRRELDAFLLAAVQAMSRLGFVSDLECLPWRPGVAAEAPDIHRRHPGVVVFRRDPGGDEAAGQVAALLVVGETPGAGIHGEAMAAALRFAQEEFSDGAHEKGREAPEGGDPPGNGPGEPAPDLKILGPTFSGSARSMASALRSWAETRETGGEPGELQVMIRSGSATNVGLDRLFESSLADLDGGGKVSVDFRAVPASNAELQSCVWNHLVPERLGLDTRWEPSDGAQLFPEDHLCAPGDEATEDEANHDNSRVALLVESSAYGRQFVGNGFHVVPYSPYLGALRAAHERRRREAAKAGSPEQDAGSVPPPTSLPLDLGVARGNRFAFDLDATLISQDLVLTALLQELARRRTEVVGIIATNTLDKLFLAERLATYTPDARVITFEGDVLLGHPTRRGSTAGMLVASSQPLSDPGPLAGGRQAVQLRFDFDAAQGLYRALVELLDEEASEPHTRHVWFTVVGQKGLHYLERVKLPPREGEEATVEERQEVSTAAGHAVSVAAMGGAGAWTGGRLPRGWWLALTVVSLALGIAVLQVIRHWRDDQDLFGLVPKDLVRPLGCCGTRPDASQRTLHALVAVVPTLLATPYLLLVLPVLGRPAPGYARAGITGLSDLLTVNGALVSVATVCFVALLVASAGLLLGLVVRSFRDARHERRQAAEKWQLRAVRCFLPLGFAVAATALAAGITAYWLPRTWRDEENGTLLVERALALGSGVSPVLPSLLIAAVPVGWIILSLYRHRVSRVLRKPLELEQGDDPARAEPEIDPATRRYHDRLEELRQAIDPGALWQGARGRWVLLVVIPLVYLALFYGLPPEWPLRSMEGWVFDLTTSVLFTMALVMVVASGISLQRGWSALRKLLDWIKGLTSSLSRENDERLGDVSLARAYATASDSRSRAEDDRDKAWKSLEGAIQEAAAVETEGPLKQLVEHLKTAIAQGCHASALVAVAHWLEATEESHPKPAESEDEEAPANGGREEGEEAEAALARHARTFFTWSTACFLRDTRVELLHLMAFMTTGLIILLAAVSAYPFEPQRVVVLYLGVLITLGAILSGTVIVQAERDRLLRSLGGPDDRRHWHQLAGRLALYAGIPMVSLLASRFPAVRDLFTNWIEPLFKVLM